MKVIMKDSGKEKIAISDKELKAVSNFFATYHLPLTTYRLLCRLSLTALLLLATYHLPLTSLVFAANPATVDLKVTVNVPLSVEIGSTAVSLGTLSQARAMKISTGAIPVTNDSSGRTEDYLISASNSANWTISASTIGTNAFVLQALVSTGTAIAPVNSDFEARFSTLSTTNANMTFENYGFNGSDGHGNSVPAGTTKYLWFRFIAPSEISQGNGVEQSISVTVTAADASTY